MRPLLPALPLAALVLAACRPAPADTWFPLVEGERMVYAVTVESDEAPPPEAWTLTVTA